MNLAEKIILAVLLTVAAAGYVMLWLGAWALWRTNR